MAGEELRAHRLPSEARVERHAREPSEEFEEYSTDEDEEEAVSADARTSHSGTQQTASCTMLQAVPCGRGSPGIVHEETIHADDHFSTDFSPLDLINSEQQLQHMTPLDDFAETHNPRENADAQRSDHFSASRMRPLPAGAFPQSVQQGTKRKFDDSVGFVETLPARESGITRQSSCSAVGYAGNGHVMSMADMMQVLHSETWLKNATMIELIKMFAPPAVYVVDMDNLEVAINKKAVSHGALYKSTQTRTSTVVAPINLGGSHWILFIGDCRKRTYELYDPRDPTKSTDIHVNKLCEHIDKFFLHERSSSWTEALPDSKLPKQTNATNCGIFVVVDAIRRMQGTATVHFDPLTAGRLFATAIASMSEGSQDQSINIASNFHYRIEIAPSPVPSIIQDQHAMNCHVLKDCNRMYTEYENAETYLLLCKRTYTQLQNAVSTMVNTHSTAFEESKVVITMLEKQRKEMLELQASAKWPHGASHDDTLLQALRDSKQYEKLLRFGKKLKAVQGSIGGAIDHMLGEVQQFLLLAPTVSKRGRV